MYISFRYMSKSKSVPVEIPITYEKLVEAASVGNMDYGSVAE